MFPGAGGNKTLAENHHSARLEEDDQLEREVRSGSQEVENRKVLPAV